MVIRYYLYKPAVKGSGFTMAITTISLNIPVEEQARKKLESICKRVGISLSEAVSSFFEEAIRKDSVVVATDPFYCESNLRFLDESDAQIKQGAVVRKTMEELEAMENE